MKPESEAQEAGEPAPDATADPALGASAETTPADVGTPPIAPDPDDTLSPAVRRLVRQYDLDVTGVHGTGPSGRIRVGDVIALLGTRAEPAASRPGETARESAAEPASAPSPNLAEAGAPVAGSRAPATQAADLAGAAPAQPRSLLTSTVFEADLGNVLAHRKQQRRDNVEPSLASYFLVACGEALKAVPEVAPATTAEPVGCDIALWLTNADGEARPLIVDIADESPLGTAADRVHALDRRLRAAAAAGDANVARSRMFIHQYGTTGSLLVTQAPLGVGHAASLGLGRVRRQVVVRNVDGEETPRVAAVCYLTLSFDAERLTLPRANRFMAQMVRVLEQWAE